MKEEGDMQPVHAMVIRGSRLALKRQQSGVHRWDVHYHTSREMSKVGCFVVGGLMNELKMPRRQGKAVK